MNIGNYGIFDNQVTIHLNKDQTFQVEPRAFIAGRHVSCETRNATSGVLNALARTFFSEESIFTNTFTGLMDGNSWVMVAPPVVGQIARYKLRDNSDKIHLLRGSFLASASHVKLTTRFEGMLDLKGIGITTIRASLAPNSETEGDVLFHSNTGSIIPVEVTPGNPVTVDNKHIIAYAGKDDDLQCSYRMLSPGIMGYFGSGEGYVCEFSGLGTVFVRTHTPPKVPEN